MRHTRGEHSWSRLYQSCSFPRPGFCIQVLFLMWVWRFLSSTRRLETITRTAAWQLAHSGHSAHVRWLGLRCLSSARHLLDESLFPLGAASPFLFVSILPALGEKAGFLIPVRGNSLEFSLRFSNGSTLNFCESNGF